VSNKDNLELWKQVCVTDPAHVKKITGKPYQGNSPKPYWLIQRATEVFGPCGEGWGVEVKSEGFHRMTETDVMHSAVVVVWYMRDGKRCAIEQMGQTKACYAKSGGGMVLDEDAGKKSVTDGMVKCLSMIGFAGDIFSGRWDDSSYVEWAAEQFKPEPQRMSDDAIQCTSASSMRPRRRPRSRSWATRRAPWPIRWATPKRAKCSAPPTSSARSNSPPRKEPA
jgi:hypothetical protein